MKMDVDVHAKGFRGGVRNYKGGVTDKYKSKEYSNMKSTEFYHREKGKVAKQLCQELKISETWAENISFHPGTGKVTLKFPSTEKYIEFMTATNPKPKMVSISDTEDSLTPYKKKNFEVTRTLCIKTGVSEKWILNINCNHNTGSTQLKFSDKSNFLEFVRDTFE